MGDGDGVFLACGLFDVGREGGGDLEFEEEDGGGGGGDFEFGVGGCEVYEMMCARGWEVGVGGSSWRRRWR